MRRPATAFLLLVLSGGAAGLSHRRSHLPRSRPALGEQPRGNAILREARGKGSPGAGGELVNANQTAAIRAEAMTSLGLNINDFWTLRSGTIDRAVPAAKRLLEEKQRKLKAAERHETKRVEAEQRLLRLVRSPCSDGRSNAQAAARLCMALGEARRTGCRIPQLLRQADALLVLLEQAAADEYQRSRGRRRTSTSAAAELEAQRREALLQQFAVAWVKMHREYDE